ncbi:MAG TPA: P1 family peptidase [Polyangia bacterium]|jgi:L-aminopeptidase/D-esterase-like protein
MSRLYRYDFPDFLVGTAEYPRGPTGCTVLTFPGGAVGAVDVRGGSVGARETTALDPLNAYGALDALFIAGGSSYGLAVGDGIMQELLRARRGDTRWEAIPAVPGAVVYDFPGRADARVLPDARLGVTAVRRARPNAVRVGRAGAGANVTVGSYWGPEYAEPGGQGAACMVIRGIRLFALTVVNAVGNILDGDGSIVAGSRDPDTGERQAVADLILDHAGRPGAAPRGNTTVSILVTSARLPRPDLARVAVMAHTALGRAIEPFHTPYDGDVCFAVSTGIAAPRKSLEAGDLGVLAGRLLQTAVLEAVTTG